jgi:uncharacterized protein YciI
MRVSAARRRTMTGSLEIAYAPFRASLLTGDFQAPDRGEWPAEFVAAHVAINNDQIADAAENVVRGQEVVYDNAPSVDENELSRFVEQVDGLVGLAEEIKRSAARLDQAYGALGDLAGTSIQVHIRNGREIAYDGPMLIGAFIEGNATRHLDLHHEQLKTLHGPWLAEPPDGFDTCQLVLLTRAAHPPDMDRAESEFLQRQHLGHFAKMRAAGYLSVAGPIDGDEEIAGICVYRARSVEEARVLAQDDPAVRAGRLEVRAMSWFTARGALAHH